MKPSINNRTLRELSQLEYQICLGLAHKDYRKRSQLIEVYNSGLPIDEQLKPVKGRRITYRGTETLLYRSQLPEAVENALDAFEGRLKSPFVGNVLLN